jgi:hypothetical protein
VRRDARPSRLQNRVICTVPFRYLGLVELPESRYAAREWHAAIPERFCREPRNQMTAKVALYRQALAVLSAKPTAPVSRQSLVAMTSGGAVMRWQYWSRRQVLVTCLCRRGSIPAHEPSSWQWSASDLSSVADTSPLSWPNTAALPTADTLLVLCEKA